MNIFRKFDQYLLQNYPAIWSTRIHLLILFWLPVFLALFFGFFSESPENYETFKGGLTTLWLMILTIAAVILWLVFLLRYNAFKQYGNLKWYSGIQQFLILFTGFFLIVSLSHSQMIGKSARVNLSYTTKELKLAENGARLIEIISGQNSFLVKKVRKVDFASESIYADMVAQSKFGAIKVVENDSEVTAYSLGGQSLYSNYNNILFTNEDGAQDTTYSQATLPMKLMNARNQKDSLAVIQEACSYIKAVTHWDYNAEYIVEHPSLFVCSPQFMYNTNGEPGTKEAQTLLAVNKLIRNCAAYRGGVMSFWKNEVQFRIWFYMAFFAALVLFVFRHMPRRTVLLTWLVLVLLPMVIALIATIIGGLKAYLNVAYFVYWLCAGIAILGAVMNAKSQWTGIGLILFTLGTPWIGVATMTILSNHYTSSEYLIMEKIEIVVFLILLQPVFYNLFARWYALPDE